MENPFVKGRGSVPKMFSPPRIFVSLMCVEPAAVFLNSSLDKSSLSKSVDL